MLCHRARPCLAILWCLAACGDDGPTSFGQEVLVASDAGDATEVAAASDAGDATDVPAPGARHPLCDRVHGLCDRLPDGNRVGEPTVIAPSDRLPVEFVSQGAHNNLDAVWHEDRLFLAVRTAPSHFASAETVLYVVSSADLATWRFEGEVAIGTDVREPQLVSWAGRLWLYYAVLGDNPFEFEPRGVRRTNYLRAGEWSAPEAVFADGLIPWRIKPIGGRLHLIGYVGGENVYDNDAETIETHWLVSDDGETWAPFLPTGPVVRVGGGSETDLLFDDEGGILAVARNEAGDDTGFGSHVCRADAGTLGDWECASDPRKFDSPLMLAHDGRAWLIARRNVTDDGRYDLGLDDVPAEDRFLRYSLDYWTRPKRCALWRVDRDSLAITHEADLPTRGDTCFPEAIALGDGLFLVFDYSSPPDAGDPSWQVAQGGPTHVYRVVVDLGDAP